MLVTAQGFTVLLQSLGLAQGLSKPSLSTVTPSNALLSGANETTSAQLSQPDQLVKAVGENDYGLGQNAAASFSPTQSVQPATNAAPSCKVVPYSVVNASGQAFAPFDQAAATIYRYRQQQSVNLGSWFVHEQWMTPSLFKCASGPKVSELDIAYGWGSHTSARTILERHWDTFINQSDFDYLASIGINTVRIPIGFWSLGPAYCRDTAYDAVADVYANAWSRVVRAINMAAHSGIGVLIDLHGAVGSQNGQPHSGISDRNTNLFTDEGNMEKTIAVLTYLMEQLGPVTNVVGIQLLNEPQNAPNLPDFYSRAIQAMRQVSSEAASFPLYIHDGFDLNRFSNYVGNRTDFVVQDHHSYFVYTASDTAESAKDHTDDVQTSVASDLDNASKQEHRNLVVDEWSCALTPQSLSSSSNPDADRKNFCEGQVDVYTNITAGWGFWSYDKEDCSDDLGWCFKAAVGQSLPSTFFSYGQGGDGASATNVEAAAANMTRPSAAKVLSSARGSPSAAPTAKSYTHAEAFGAPTPSATEDDAYSTSDQAASPTSSSSPPAFSPPFRRTSLSHLRHLQDFRFPTADSSTDDDLNLVVFDGLSMTRKEVAVAKGYSDGFMTAKIFAMYDASKLGFTGQYISDSLQTLGDNVVSAGNEDVYREWFLNGLADGEAVAGAAPPPGSNDIDSY